MKKTAPNYNFGRLIKHIWKVLILRTGDRISVGEYLLASICLSIVSFILLTAVGSSIVLSIVINILVIAYSITLMIKRLHDQGKRWTHLFYILIPIYNIIRGIRVSFYKGTPGENKYGADPLAKQPKSNGMYWGFWFLGFFIYLLCMFVVIMIQAAIMLPTTLNSGTNSDAIFGYPTSDIQMNTDINQ